MVLATFFSFWRTLIWIWLFDFFNFLRRLVKKTDILPDRKRCPPPLYGQLFVIFWCSFDLLLLLYVFRKDFTQVKVNFHATTGIPNSSSYCCCLPDDYLQEASPSYWPYRDIFWDYFPLVVSRWYLSITASLVQFEGVFNTYTKKWQDMIR